MSHLQRIKRDILTATFARWLQGRNCPRTERVVCLALTPIPVPVPVAELVMCGLPVRRSFNQAQVGYTGTILNIMNGVVIYVCAERRCKPGFPHVNRCTQVSCQRQHGHTKSKKSDQKHGCPTRHFRRIFC